MTPQRQDLARVVNERLAERRARVVRRAADRKAERERRRAARAAGLKIRHARKLSRGRGKEGDQQ